MKLYWRIKKAGKWTWTPAKMGARVNDLVTLVENYQEEEE